MPVLLGPESSAWSRASSRTADYDHHAGDGRTTAIPSILLAIALVALNGPSVGSVIAAITIPEIPRVVRLVRAVVLSARGGAYPVDGRHRAPGTAGMRQRSRPPPDPNTVRATSIVCRAPAILASRHPDRASTVASLGAGVSTETPTWGNIMAEGRLFFRIKPELILYPGIALSLCILSINLLGDAARDMLDPRLKKRAG